MMEKEPLASPKERRPHCLTLDDRRRAELTGVSEVLAFDENQVILLTECGEIAFSGENLHVTKLLLEEGKLTVEGKVDSVIYTQRPARRSLFKRGGT